MAGSVYEVKISVEDLAPLDGSTPIGANAGIARDDQLGLIEVRIPAGTAFGLFDPGQLVDLQGETFLVASVTVINSVATHAAGSVVGIRSPDGPGGAGTKDRTVLDLSTPPALGIDQLTQILVPIDHQLFFDTAADGAAPGPHTIQVTLITLTDDEAFTAFAGAAGGAVSEGADFLMEFGVRSLAGSGANPRHLWPGAGRTIAQAVLVGEPLPAASILKGLSVHQQRPPAASPESVTYTVLVDGVPTAVSITIPVTDGTVNTITGFGIPVAADASIAVRALRSGNHPTIIDVLSNVLMSAP